MLWELHNRIRENGIERLVRKSESHQSPAGSLMAMSV